MKTSDQIFTEFITNHKRLSAALLIPAYIILFIIFQDRIYNAILNFSLSHAGSLPMMALMGLFTFYGGSGFLRLAGYLAGDFVQQKYGKGRTIVTNKFLTALYYDGLEYGILYIKDGLFFLLFIFFYDIYGDRNDFLLSYNLPLFPILFLCGRLLRHIDTSDPRCNVKPIWTDWESKVVLNKRKSKAATSFENLDLGKVYLSVKNEYPFLRWYERAVNAAFFILPVFFWYGKEGLLYPYNDEAVGFVSTFIRLSLAILLVLAIILNRLNIQFYLHHLMFRVILLFSVINIIWFNQQEESFHKVFIEQSLVAYCLEFASLIHRNYLVSFKVSPSKVISTHIAMLVGMTCGLIISGFTSILKSSIDSHVYSVKLIPAFLVSVGCIYVAMKQYFEYGKAKKVSIFASFAYLITTGLIFVSTIHLNKIGSGEAAILIAIFSCSIILFASDNRLSNAKLFILKTSVLLLTFGHFLNATKLLSVEKILEFSYQGKDLFLKKIYEYVIWGLFMAVAILFAKRKSK